MKKFKPDLRQLVRCVGVVGVACALAACESTPPAPRTLALAASDSSLTLAAGTSITLTVVVTRINFEGTVQISIVNQPAGLTVAPTGLEIPSDQSSTTITFTALPSASPGQFTLTIMAAAEGVDPKQIDVEFDLSPHTTTISQKFCSPGIPVWLAYRNDGDVWRRVAGDASGTFTFDATDRVAVAYVVITANDTTTTVVFATPAELTAGPQPSCRWGTRELYGTVAGLGPNDAAVVTMASSEGRNPGVAGANPTAANPAFTIPSLPEGPFDLVATSQNRVIIRRNIDLASGSMMPAIDFSTAEVVSLVSTTLTFNPDLNFTFGGEFRTANGTTHPISPYVLSGSTATLYSVPTSLQATGDRHAAILRGRISSSSNPNHRTTRFYVTPADMSITKAGDLGPATITTLAQTPSVRLKATFSGAYGQLGRIDFLQTSAKSVHLVGSQSYADSVVVAPSIPDFTGVDGWQADWGLHAGVATTWTAYGLAGRAILYFGGLPLDGESISESFRGSTTAFFP